MKFPCSCVSSVAGFSSSFSFFPKETSHAMSLLTSSCFFRQLLETTGRFLFSFLSENQEVSENKHLLSSTRSPECHRMFDATILSHTFTRFIYSVSKCSQLYVCNLTSTDLIKCEFICWCLPRHVCVVIKAEYTN
jgi:hypothetical protein